MGMTLALILVIGLLGCYAVGFAVGWLLDKFLDWWGKDK